MPYYLLLVGGPEAIPYAFQYQLDVQYAVGRLHFATPEEYARYARSVVAAETRGRGPRPPLRRGAFFGAQNADDRATQLSATELVAPWREAVPGAHPGWAVETALGEGATKARLGALLGGAETPPCCSPPATAWASPTATPRQPPTRGPCCARTGPGPWPGPGRSPQDFYLAPDDVPTTPACWA